VVGALSDFRDISAVVTGASSGIGKLLALRLALEGARVVLTARRGVQLEEVAASIRDAGGEAMVRECDVGDRDAVFATARWAEDKLGGVDLLINNAGYGHHRSFVEWDVDDIENMMRVNYLGSVYWTKALLPAMLERERGWLVFMASVAGRIGVPDESAYAASKFAMVGLAEALSFEVEDQGVHVLTVCPGAIRTEFFDDEALRRMPATAKQLMAEPADLVDATIDALKRGKRELTFPRAIATGYVVRAVAPGLMRMGIKRTTRRPSS
jgi:short-subunit dehydrogenase